MVKSVQDKDEASIAFGASLQFTKRPKVLALAGKNYPNTLVLTSHKCSLFLGRNLQTCYAVFTTDMMPNGLD